MESTFERRLETESFCLAIPTHIICDRLPKNRPFAQKQMKIHFSFSKPKIYQEYDEP